MRVARLTVLGLVASSSLVLVATPAHAATIARVGNDGVKSFSVADSYYYPKSQEAVVLHANPDNTQADVPGTITSTGCTVVTENIPNSSCAGPLAFTADTTNVLSGTYDVVETATAFGASSGTSTVRGQVVAYSQPRFAGATPVTPAVRGQNSLSTITLKGTGFSTGMTATFGAGTAPSPVMVSSPTQATVDVDVVSGAVLGARDVVLTSADDGTTPGTKATAVLPGGFSITDAPTLTSDTPPPSGVTDVTTTVTFHGTHFADGPDFRLNVPNVAVSNVVVTATTVKADLKPNLGARAGPRSAFVVNNDGGRVSLTNAFTVVAPPDAPTTLAVYPSDASVTLTWAPPANTGSGPVTGYRVFRDGTAVVDVTSPSAPVLGLTNGTSYTFTVAAKNDVATNAGPLYGALSAPISATPKFGTVLTAKSSVGTLVAGQTAALSGKLTKFFSGTAISGATVTLRYAPQVGGAFTRTVTTATDGTWTDTLLGTYTTTVTAAYAGSADQAASPPASVLVRVAPKVTVSGPRSGATSKASTVLAITGAVSPNKAGRTVYLVQVVHGRQYVVSRTIVARNGAYRFSVRPTRGTYVFAVTIGTTPGNVPGTSARFIVKRT